MFRALLVTSVGLVALCAGSLVDSARPDSARTGQVALPGLELAQPIGFVNGRLVPLDPDTLLPVRARKRIRVGSGGCAPRQGGTACWTVPPWTVSPGGQFIAVAMNDASKIRFVRVNPLNVPWDLPLDSGSIGALAWLARSRMLALEEIAGERQRLLVIDLPSQRVVARRPLDGAVQALARTGRDLVLLLAPPRSIGPARVAVVNARGGVRTARVSRLLAGSKLLATGSNHRVDARSPGFTVDPTGRQAYVVGQDLAAEIDLQTLEVSYHTLGRRPSLFSRLWNWLEPAAAAKRVSGYDRRAQWLGGGLIAVSGTDSENDRQYASAGLRIIDTRDWSTRTIDATATGFIAAGDLLLATGLSPEVTPFGVVAYAFDGTRAFQLLEGTHAWVSLVYRGRAYVGVAGDAEPLRIVDLATGQIVGTRRQLPWLLLGAGSGWWG
jgi:hypothetical protein